MQKITPQSFRAVKTITLPVSQVTVEIYPSLLVGEVAGLDMKESEMMVGIQAIAKLIRAWNFFENESDEQALDVSIINVSRLPAPDIEFLSNEAKAFSTEEKKS